MRYLRLDERLQLKGDTLLAMCTHAVTAIAQSECLPRRSLLRDAIGDRIVCAQNENDAPNSLSLIDFVREWLLRGGSNESEIV